ncbi:efflux RND transporter periplasmic adaptor subunit [Oceanobacillus picturae]|uniref:efflux RND transporter periplasmic adaptor subunit n=1 Tax=Oceanobacillus picturae TaxID=171693 RepID=UPI000E699FF7|nr:efflux RND transporter periplasmic adaptor subunit [Oceanobacillus picturae]RIU94955.1 efflux RND transporter periplasmic adaptor subunit [Oceanobacillus picturae]
MKRWMIGITAVFLIGILAACNQDEDTNQEEEKRVIPVETQEAKNDNLVIERSLYGRAAASSTSPIMLQAAGELDSLEVENGEMVEEDDLIATISTPAGNQNIRASRDGEVTQLRAAEGDMVSAEEPFAVIADLDELKLNFTVTSDVVGLLKTGDTYQVEAADKEYEAEISSVDSMPGENGLYPVQATLSNEEKDLLPGVIASMKIPEETISDAIIVPTEAVNEENEESFVFLVKDNKAERVVVTVLETQSENTAIEGDVSEGDQIIVSGHLGLTDGDQVSVTGGE